MPAIMCKCGEPLRYGEIPNPIEWLFIADTEFEKYSGEVDSESLYRMMKSFLKCNNCSRIYIFWSGFGGEAVKYLLHKD